MEKDLDYGAFMKKFLLHQSSSEIELPLNSLTFAIKEIFDVDGHVTGFGNPDWIKTHSTATSTAPAVLAILSAGATCVGTTVMDEMAYSINGENEHYGTPKNPFAPDRVPRGSSSGSAVAVGANIVDFSLGTDTGGSDLIKHVRLGDYVQEKVPSLKYFLSEGNVDKEYNIPSLAALSSAMRLLQRYEFKNNHGEWVTAVKPNLGPGISERVWEAIRTTDENIDVCHSVKAELRAVLTDLLGDHGALAIPTVPGHPPKLQTTTNTLKKFCARGFSLLSIAGVSGFCQVSIPLGLYENIPVSVSLLAKHSSNGFLLNLVETLYDTLKEKVEIAINMSS